MIVDAHCHAWARWPYQPPVPDPESRARAEQLLFEMDRNGVGRAVVICAAIGGNPDNNAYVHEAAGRSGGRLVPFADVDSRWLPVHHAPGAADRLREAAQAYGLVGFTHYLNEDEDASWLLGPDGTAFLEAAADLNLILSLACGPGQMPVVAEVAARVPIPILCHHMARLRAASPGRTGLKDILAAASRRNVLVKLSGFGYAAGPGDAFPYPDLAWAVRALYEFYGPERLCWGSDEPVVRRYMTYAQSLEVARRHCRFMPEEEQALVFGGTMARLLAEREA